MMRLEALGQQVAAIQDADRQARRVTEREGERFVRSLRKTRVRRGPTWLLAATVLTTLAASLTFWLKAPSPAPFDLTRTPGVAVGRPLDAPKDGTLALGFSDGSKLSLDPGSKANVRQLTSNGATIALETGRAEVAVVHRPSTHWAFEVGPYRVLVTGTRFDLGWSPTTQRLELNLVEGSVVVTNLQNGHAKVTMTAPERLVIDHDDWQLSPGSNARTAEVIPPALEAVPSPPPAAGEPPDREPTEPRDSKRRETQTLTTLTPNVEDWHSLGKNGRFADAYRRASDLGIPSLTESSSAPNLLSLAEICRFSGHASEAMQVLTKLRQRFSGSNEAAIAAFQLGRLSSDGALAASWFRSYLKESPNGALAREASGRLLEALDRAGDHAGAARAAAHYLERYPSGPHAKFARRLTSP